MFLGLTVAECVLFLATPVTLRASGSDAFSGQGHKGSDQEGTDAPTRCLPAVELSRSPLSGGSLLPVPRTVQSSGWAGSTHHGATAWEVGGLPWGSVRDLAREDQNHGG